MPDCIIDAVLNPDVAGPINAEGAIKHPDKVTPSTTIKSNLLIIESLGYFFKSYSVFKIKKRDKIFNFLQLKVEIYFSKLIDLFAIIPKFL